MVISVVLICAVSFAIYESLKTAEAKRACDDFAIATQTEIAARSDDLAALCPLRPFP